MIRVFVVDDSAFVRRALARILNEHTDISICGEAATARDALAKYETFAPDLITLDVELPDSDGVSALRELQKLDPGVRAIMVSTHSPSSMDLALEALALGALDFVDRSRWGVLDVEGFAAELLGKIRLLGQRTRRTRPPLKPTRATGSNPAFPAFVPPATVSRKSGSVAALLTKIDWIRYDLCCIGASTGGPPAVEALLKQLPADFPVPLAIVQHMPAGFTRSFAERLAGVCKIAVTEARGGDRLLAGMAVLAPGGAHLRVGEGRVVQLTSEPAGGHVPSVDVLMSSAAAVCGRRVLGLLLTGMGEDGAEGMAAIRLAGGLTIGESEASCVVYGMPRAAFEKGGVQHLLPLSEIKKLFAQS